MASGTVSGIALAEIAAGLILAWSGIENISVQSIVKSFVSGKLPAPGPGVTYATAATSAAGTDADVADTTPLGDTGASTAEAVKNQAIGKLMAGPYGWSTGAQWSALVSLWNRESGWDNTAENPSSGAYGIPQALPASKMGALANPPTSSATAQIAWGLAYIKSTYGSPEAAWAHEESQGWY